MFQLPAGHSKNQPIGCHNCFATGRFREERSIDPTTGELHFKLQGMEANSSAWGRKFKRKGTFDGMWIAYDTYITIYIHHIQGRYLGIGFR